ncbi:MAG TPA: Rrf2 family transcriptional regulator [Acetobacteraceae bacterium]|jgi:Rrf2 family protein|nr:Rrf2 family transcriptional regulator [Acetobacteraceae bacterium]
MLSSKAKYALRAVLRLAEGASSGEWLQTGDVAEHEQVPRKFLEAIFVQLRDHGIIESRRGAQGGHRFLRDPATISVADIIRILDGPLALTPCASRTRFRQCADCVDISECRLQPLMQQARDAIAGVLENCSLAELARTHQTSKKRQRKRRETASKIDSGSHGLAALLPHPPMSAPATSPAIIRRRTAGRSGK